MGDAVALSVARRVKRKANLRAVDAIAAAGEAKMQEAKDASALVAAKVAAMRSAAAMTQATRAASKALRQSAQKKAQQQDGVTSLAEASDNVHTAAKMLSGAVKEHKNVQRKVNHAKVVQAA